MNCVLFTASTLVVILRSITRLGITRNFGIDDAVMILTQMTNCCGMGFVAAEVSNGLGRHKSYLAPGSFKKYLKYDYLDWIQVFVTLLLMKVAICLFLLRLSNFRKLRLWLYGLIVLLVTSHVPLIFLMIFQCSPISKYWTNPLEGPGACFSKNTVELIIIIQGVFSIVSDFICAAFPIVLLWDVQISKRTKIALCFLMGLGVITAFASIVRTALSGLIKSSDVTWKGLPNALARMFEINLGIIAACAPIMKPFCRYVHARATGRDPREVLYRTTTPSVSHNHEAWYKRWIFGSRHGSTSDKSVLHNPFHYPSSRRQPEQDSGTPQSLHLPLQGPMVETHISGGVSVLHEERSKRSLQSQYGPRYDVQYSV